jgi:acylphosphatase
MERVKSVRLRVTGRVQGVCFRSASREEALRLRLCGCVCNESDGSVTLIASGDDAAVDTFIAWCGKGPPAARVESVQVFSIDPPAQSSFMIRTC